MLTNGKKIYDKITSILHSLPVRSDGLKITKDLTTLCGVQQMKNDKTIDVVITKSFGSASVV